MTAAQIIKSRSTSSVGGRFIAHAGFRGGSALMDAPRPYTPQPVSAPCSVMGGGASSKRIRHERMLADHEARRLAKQARRLEQARARQEQESVLILSQRDTEENGRSGGADR